MTFSEQIVYAMFKPAKYKEMLSLKKSRAVLFVITMMLVLGIVNFVIPVGAFITSLGGFGDLFENKIGNITYQDGTLNDDRKYDISYDGIHFLIDTEDELVADEKLKKDGVYIALGSKAVKLSAVSGDSYVTYKTIYYSGFLPDGFSNQSLINNIPFIYGYLFFVFIFSCVGYFIKYAAFAVLLGIMLDPTAQRLGINLGRGQMFMLCFYGETLGIIISNFNAALGLLPSLVGSFIGIFVTTRMITTALAYMHQGNKL